VPAAQSGLKLRALKARLDSEHDKLMKQYNTVRAKTGTIEHRASKEWGERQPAKSRKRRPRN